MTDDIDLRDALDDLAGYLVSPNPTTDVTARAIDALVSDPVPRAEPRRRWLVAAGIAVAVAVGVAGVPPAREAVADLLGLGGVRITLQGGLQSDLDSILDLGRPVSLADARRLAPGPLPLPDGIDAPAAAFAGRPQGGVTLAWAPTENLPEVLDHGVGLLVAAFPGRLGRDVIEKRVLDDGTVERTTVDGEPAYWLAGTPHELVYLDERGRAQTDTIRLSGNALVWTRDGVTYRLESALARPDAIRLAASLPR